MIVIVAGETPKMVIRPVAQPGPRGPLAGIQGLHVTQAEYAALSFIDPTILYIITA
jgi:hypothetical protein